jgi:hypothetical protein
LLSEFPSAILFLVDPPQLGRNRELTARGADPPDVAGMLAMMGTKRSVVGAFFGVNLAASS